MIPFESETVRRVHEIFSNEGLTPSLPLMRTPASGALGSHCRVVRALTFWTLQNLDSSSTSCASLPAAF